MIDHGKFSLLCGSLDYVISNIKKFLYFLKGKFTRTILFCFVLLFFYFGLLRRFVSLLNKLSLEQGGSGWKQKTI